MRMFSEQDSLGGLPLEFAELGSVLRVWLRLLEEAFVRALVERYHVGAIREARPNLRNIFCYLVLNASKDEDFLVAFVVTDDAEAVVAYMVHSFACDRVFDIEPNFLVE